MRKRPQAVLVVAALLIGVPASPRSDTLRLAGLNALFQKEVYRRVDSALVHAAAYRRIAIAHGTVRHRAIASAMHGQAWAIKGHRARALPWFHEALSLYGQLNDTASLAMIHGNIGAIHQDERRYELARREFAKSLEGFRRTGQPIWAAGILGELAKAYEGLGMRDSAIAYYERSYAALEVLGMGEHADDSRLAQAGLELEEGEDKRALALYRTVMTDTLGANDDVLRCQLLLQVGNRAVVLGQFARADSALHRALRSAIAGGFDPERSEAHRALSDLYAEQRVPDSALAHLRLHLQWKDSLDSHRTSAAVAELQERFDGARKDAELQRSHLLIAEQRTLLIAYAGGALLLLLIAIVLAIGYRRDRRMNRALGEQNATIGATLKERELLLRELHHRVKNNMQTVSSLLRLQARSVKDPAAQATLEEAVRRVRSMALVHQDLYLDANAGGVAMDTYVEKLAGALLRGHGMADRITVALEVAPVRLDADTAVPLGLILNELITNALKHAFPDGRSGAIRITIEDRSQMLVMTVCDDGVGFVSAQDQGTLGSGADIVATFADTLKAEWTVLHDKGTTVRMVVRNFLRA